MRQPDVPGRKLVDDPEESRDLRLLDQVCPVLLEKFDPVAGTACRQCMVGGLVEVPVFGEPRPGGAVTLFDSLGPGTASHIAHNVMLGHQWITFGHQTASFISYVAATTLAELSTSTSPRPRIASHGAHRFDCSAQR
jgi:hypothetical protein